MVPGVRHGQYGRAPRGPHYRDHEDVRRQDLEDDVHDERSARRLGMLLPTPLGGRLVYLLAQVLRVLQHP
jgi:hypothetical protein